MSATRGEHQPLTLIHTSDLHVGSDLYPEEAMRGLRAVLAIAQKKADALLIAGDMLDSERVPAITIQEALESMESLDMPVVVLPGNHDVALVNGRRPLSLPSNVHLIRLDEGETVRLPDHGLTVWGRPVLDHTPLFRPLEGLPSRPPSGWYVVMAHGMVIQGWEPLSPSSPITEDELAAANCDYIALGHVHVFRDVSQGKVPAFYSGAPSGPPGRGTAALVTLEPGLGASVTAIPLNRSIS